MNDPLNSPKKQHKKLWMRFSQNASIKNKLYKTNNPFNSTDHNYINLWSIPIIFFLTDRKTPRLQRHINNGKKIKSKKFHILTGPVIYLLQRNAFLFCSRAQGRDPPRKKLKTEPPPPWLHLLPTDWPQRHNWLSRRPWSHRTHLHKRCVGGVVALHFFTFIYYNIKWNIKIQLKFYIFSGFFLKKKKN
jgi:hypothetical protein